MPSAFKCPSCHNLNVDPGAPLQGYEQVRDQRCQKCGLQGICWVANQESADIVAKGGDKFPPVPRQLITIGSFSAAGAAVTPAPSATPAMSTHQKIEHHFAKNNTATKVEWYSQRDRIAMFSADQPDTLPGVCAGICLHWVRRVIQGGKSSFQPQAQKGGVTRTEAELQSRMRQHHHVGVAAQRQFTNAGRTGYDQRYNAICRQYAERMASRGIYRNGDGTWTCRPGDEPVVAQLMAKMKETACNDAGTFNDVTWSAMARELDAKFAQAGGKNRRFGNIVAARCVFHGNGGFSSMTAAAFARAVIREDSEFQQGRAIHISVGLATGIGEDGSHIGGHAVAIYFAGPDNFLLFDPNLGVFRAGSRDKIQEALEILLDTVWVDMGWQINGSFGYSIFRVADVVQPRPHEQAVDFRSNMPIVTTVQNQAIGTIPTLPTQPVAQPVAQPLTSRPRRGAVSTPSPRQVVEVAPRPARPTQPVPDAVFQR